MWIRECYGSDVSELYSQFRIEIAVPLFGVKFSLHRNKGFRAKIKVHYNKYKLTFLMDSISSEIYPCHFQWSFLFHYLSFYILKWIHPGSLFQRAGLINMLENKRDFHSWKCIRGCGLVLCERIFNLHQWISM